MAKAGIIEIDLEANTARFQSDMKKATASLNSNVAKMRKSTSELSKSFNSVKKAFNGFIAVFAVQKIAEVGGELLRTADRFNTLEARVKSAVGEAGNFKKTFDDIVVSSNRSGASIDTVASAFARLKPAALDLGVTNKELIRFNETFSKMGTLAGATSEELSQTMIQLSQGIASGRLQGDELRSVMEQMPKVARTIAESMGIPFSEFRKAAKEGKVTAEAVFNAILGKADEVDREFSKMPGTLDRSMNAITNQFTVMVGKVNQTAGITKTLTSDLKDLSGWLKRNEEDITRLMVGLSAMIKLMYDLIKVAVRVTGALATVFSHNYLKEDHFGKLAASQQGISYTELKKRSENTYRDNLGRVRQKPSPIQKPPSHNIFKNMIRSPLPLHKSDASNDSNLVAALSSIGGDRFDIPMSQLMGGVIAGGAAPISSRRSSENIKLSKEQMRDLKIEAEFLTEAMRTIWEVEADEINKANKLLKLHLIDHETYNRALKEAGKTASDAFELKGLKEAMEVFRKPSQDFIDNFNTSLNETDTAFQEVQRVIEATKTPLENYNEQVEYLNYLHDNAGLSTSNFTRAMAQAKEELDSTSKKGQQFSDALGNVVSQFGDGLFETMTSGLRGAKVSFSDFVSSALMDLSKLIFKLTVTIPLANALSGAIRGHSAGGLLQGLGKGLATFAGSLFGGGGFSSGLSQGITFAANGADASAGQPFIIGERGPELFVPNTAGKIIPNHQLSTGGGQAVHVTNVFQISTGVQQTVRAEIMQMMPQIEKRTTRAVQSATDRGGGMSKAVGRKS